MGASGMVPEPLAGTVAAALLSGMLGADRGAACVGCPATGATAAASLGAGETGAGTGAESGECWVGGALGAEALGMGMCPGLPVGGRAWVLARGFAPSLAS